MGPPARETGLKRGRRSPGWGTLALVSVLLFLAVVLIWQVIEVLWFPRPAPETLYVLHMTRGLSAASVIGVWAVWYILRSQHAFEDELRQSEELFRGVVEHSRDAITVLDTSALVREWNRSAETLFGYRREEVVGGPLPIVPPQGQAEFQGFVDRVRRGERLHDVEIDRRHRDGRLLRVMFSAYPVFDTEGVVRWMTALYRDVTEQRRLQRLAIENERLAMVGKMAARVAHEIRNPLGAISLNTELLQDEVKDLPHGEGAKAHIHTILSEIERLNNVIEEYLAFARLPKIDRSREGLNSVVTEVVGLIQETAARQGIAIRVDLAEGIPEVEMDRAQLKSALLNLVRNGIEAMPKGGVLTFRTSQRRGEPPPVLSGAAPTSPSGSPQTLVGVEVSDTGHGIPPDAQERLFEPFFTTKEGGTGLGLAHSRQVVHEHGGCIDCVSEVGRGTTFVVILPVAEGVALG